MTGPRTVVNLGVPRTGTVYISQAMSPLWPRAHYHLIPSDWTAASFTPLNRAELPGDAYLFGVVRNPFELLVSHFGLLQRFDAMLHHYDRALAALSFRDYVTLCAHRHQLYPQRFPLHFQLFDERWRLGVDYLGRYETLDADLRTIAGITGATYTPAAPVNTSEHGDWRSYYDDALSRVVEDAWFADLAFFGYDRHGPTGTAKVTFGAEPHPTGRLTTPRDLLR